LPRATNVSGQPACVILSFLFVSFFTKDTQSKAVRAAIGPRRSSINPVTAQWLAPRASS
jgi:hypothetical protein